MITCEEIQARMFVGEKPDEAMAAHVRGCPHCQRQLTLTRTLITTFAQDVPPDPPADLSARVLDAARPELAARARAVRSRRRWALGRAIGAAVAPFPFIIVLDAYLLRAINTALSVVLPAALSAYMVFNYAIMVVVLITLTYAAVPLLAERQARHLRRHGLA